MYWPGRSDGATPAHDGNPAGSTPTWSPVEVIAAVVSMIPSAGGPG